MKEWYLMTNNTRPNALGGFENESYTDFKEDAFVESLETNIASTVILYNSDLSKGKDIRCIVQGNTADTQLKSLERTILAPIGTLKAGIYIYYDDSYWLLTGYLGNNKIYEKITASLCNFKLRWQNSSGRIIERWVYSTDFTKYSSGTTGNNTVTVGDNQYGLILPIDDEIKALKRDMRFPIDFDDAIEPDVYSLTNRKVVLYNYLNSNKGGTMILTMSFDAFNKDSDKHVTLNDGTQAWICGYHASTALPTSTEPNETTDLCAFISGNTNLKCGYSRVYTVSFTDKDDNEISDVDFNWNIVSDFDIEQIISGDTIKLKVSDGSLIRESFLLQVLVDDIVIAEVEITIIDDF